MALRENQNNKFYQTTKINPLHTCTLACWAALAAPSTQKVNKREAVK